MDYRNPIRALFPGVEGAVLSVLAQSGQSLTLRQIAVRAGSSHPQVAHHVERFESLGIVSRRVVGRSHLVALTGSAVGMVLRELDRLHDVVLSYMRETADQIVPAAESLIVFGSFARRTAGADSDIDLLVVRPSEVEPDHGLWHESLAQWLDDIAERAASPVAEIVVDRMELIRHRDEPLWAAIRSEGIVISGRPLEELARGTSIDVARRVASRQP